MQHRQIKMEGDKRQRMQVEEMSKSPCRNPSVGDDIHLSILKELDGLVEVRRFKERDSKISTLLQLWVSLITNPTKTDHISKAFFTLFRKTTVAILSPDWMSVTLSLKEKLINAVDIAGQALKPVIEDSSQLCGVLRRTAQEPWKNKAWKHILDGSLDIDDQNVCYCLAAEPEDVLLARVQFLAQSGCERQAMSLAKCCFKFFNRFKNGTWPIRTHDTLNSNERQGPKVANYCRFSSMEWFLFLLQKKNKLSDIVKETSNLSCHEGVQLIKFLRIKCTSDPLCPTLTNIFLVRDFMFPSKYCCTRDLIVLWVSLHEKKKMTDIADAVRKLLVSYASTSAHFYLFVDVLWEQFGSKLLSLYVEMYVRGLTADVNFLEVARSNEMRETVQELETHISNIWHKLSTLYDDGCEEVARECMLSAFSMRPTQERLYILQSLTHSILSESQMKTYASEQQEETTSSFGKPEMCRNTICKCDFCCSDDAENCAAAAESNQSFPLHPLLRRGIKGISYALVKDLVSLLECVRCKTFQFNCFDWYKRSSELGDYLNAYVRNASVLFFNEDVGYRKSRGVNINPLFHHGGDDMDTESPSDEDMDYESSASDRLSGNFPLVSSEGVSIHQSPLTVPFKQEQTSWAHSKSESVPPLKTSPLFVDSADFAPKGVVKHPPHICQSSKSSSFNPLMNSSIGTNSNVAKEMHANFMNSNRILHTPHMEHRHTTKSVHSPCSSNLTVAGATEAMLRSVIMNSSPVPDGFASTSNSFLNHNSNNSGASFGMPVHGSHMPTVQSHSPQYSAFPHDMTHTHVKSPEIANLSLNRMQHFLPSSPNAGIHQSKSLPSCGNSKEVIDEALVQKVSRTANSINVPHSVFSQNVARSSNLNSDMESNKKILGHHGSNYIPQGNVCTSSENLLLSTQERRLGSVLSDKEIQGNMLLSLLENHKSDITTGAQNDSIPSILNSASHKVPDRLPTDETLKAGNLPNVPSSFLHDNKASDILLPEASNLKAKSLNIGEQNSVTKHVPYANISGDTSEGQVCSKIPIPVSVNRIPITKMTVEQLNSHEEKKSIPAFKISMPPDMKKPFRNWFFPANLVIPKSSNAISGDSSSESNNECLLDGNSKPSENNAISIPGFIVFKSNKGKYFPSPKVVTGESGTACQTPIQKKTWTSFRSPFGEVACKTMSGSDVSISAPVQNVHLNQPEKCTSDSVQEDQQSIGNNEQGFFQSATGTSLDKSAYSSHNCSALGAERETSQFFSCSSKSGGSLPSATAEPSVKTVASCYQTSSVASNIPHVISVLGKDMHSGLSVCSERKMPPQNVSVGSSDKNLPLLDMQNSNKLERLGSPSVSTDKMCCSENEVVPCQSCSLSAAQVHQNDQSLKAGLSQRRDATGVKPSGTSNMNSKNI